MKWHDVISIASTIALFLPVILILALRLFNNKNFVALMIYFILAVICNLMISGVLPVSAHVKRTIGIANNLLDTPLILWFLSFFTTSWRLTKQIKTVILIFIIFEIVIIALFGYSIKTITITTGLGIMLNIIYGTYFFFQQSRITIMLHKETGKAIMTAALLFAYGCFGFVYLFFYIIKTPNVDDVFLVFYITSIIWPVLMSVGIWMERKKIRHPDEDMDREDSETISLSKNKLNVFYKPSIFDKDKYNFN
ncbi:MAG: hypothetical protein M3O67_08350 [Bacteroidota bacterium]|nr:hypothetical protein [Bacteroidota bacterium]